jgi:hypothetical protein
MLWVGSTTKLTKTVPPSPGKPAGRVGIVRVWETVVSLFCGTLGMVIEPIATARAPGLFFFVRKTSTVVAGASAVLVATGGEIFWAAAAAGVPRGSISELAPRFWTVTVTARVPFHEAAGAAYPETVRSGSENPSGVYASSSRPSKHSNPV